MTWRMASYSSWWCLSSSAWAARRRTDRKAVGASQLLDGAVLGRAEKGGVVGLMASMEHEEVVDRLKRLIANVEKAGKDKTRLALVIALDAVRQEHKWAMYGDCNTCTRRAMCQMAPEWGCYVRRNCPHYAGVKKLEPWRG